MTRGEAALDRSPDGGRYIVRAAQTNDRTAWLEMWQGYCEFYEVTIPIDITEVTWSRIVSAKSSVHAVVAVVVRPARRPAFQTTLSIRLRGAIARHAISKNSLCDHQHAEPALAVRSYDISLHSAAKKSWGRLYWMTRQDNHVARRLYDRFAAHDDFIRYVVISDRTPAD